MNKYIYLIAFAIMPILNMIRKIVIGQAYEFRHYIALFIPILTYIFLGYFITSYLKKHDFSNKFMAVTIGVLVGIDQIAKLIIYRFLGNKAITLPGNLFMLKIVKNEQISALFNILGLTLPGWITTIARLMVLIVLLIFYRYCEEKYQKDSYLNLTKILTYAMVICSIMDSALWGYTLDFIVFKGLQAIDIKDIYAQLGIGTLLMYGIKNDLFVIKKYNN
ncbi:MAG: signal peptidase II [Tissierellia bacterium]|nr:signal peptidase II [Tissierellia bacterium]